jgi:hypothetical protein
MAGLDPAIHVLLFPGFQDVMPGTRPGVTISHQLTIVSPGKLARARKRPQRPFGQDRVAILPDFLDLAVLQPEHQAIVVVVAIACLGEVVALRGVTGIEIGRAPL